DVRGLLRHVAGDDEPIPGMVGPDLVDHPGVAAVSHVQIGHRPETRPRAHEASPPDAADETAPGVPDPSTIHRSPRTRNATATSRISTKTPIPHQMPTRPQPKCRVARRIGRKPHNAAITVVVRR